MPSPTSTHSVVRDRVQSYYGQVLKSSADLQTSACCPIGTAPAHIQDLLANVHPEVLDTFYGCGCPLPPLLDGCTVLDLGSGSGRDAYLLAQLVGPSGRVIGVDMTAEQLAIANRHLDYHADRFGYANVDFRHGYIEDLADAGIADDSVDLVVSNCVVNLSPAKDLVFAEIFRVLKPGGELYFSDVYADRRIPDALRQDPVLHGECLSGALYIDDFRRLLAASGCLDYRVVSDAPLAVQNPDLEARLGAIRFQSTTVRAFKLDLEDRCEDYGQVAYYRGGIPEAPHVFDLDDHHRLERDRPLLVCGNTADMLSQTRYAPYFEIVGDKGTHFGPFGACGSGPTTESDTCSAGACC